ncbi:hypothetical protein OC25_18780 [Pedobacter kyungheensis]|uniref:Uncharacterized protein n=1 Tax=Pedobacter kyungheensis TaxID=1069985 RepID=A0A0C1D554_9SPHI|nr:hypothetical protein OC25_18780 [Pedobacter kyungheensis]
MSDSPLPGSSFRAAPIAIGGNVVEKSVLIDFSIPPPVKNRPAPSDSYRIEMTILLLGLSMVFAEAPNGFFLAPKYFFMLRSIFAEAPNDLFLSLNVFIEV